MTVQADTIGLEGAHVAAEGQTADGVGFAWAVIAVSSWFVGGFFLDAWAHRHGEVDDTFFTPWHAIAYAGFLAAAGLLVSTAIINRARGHSWRRVMSAGYGLSLLGVPLFAAGGVADLIWHSFFGFEGGVEILVSPAHLLLVLAMVFIASGPLRAAWCSQGAERADGLGAQLPMLLSLALTLSLFTYMTQFAHPLVNPWVAPLPSALVAVGDGLQRISIDGIIQSLGVASILLQIVLLMGFVLLALRRWALPPGALTIIFTVNGTLMGLLQDQYRLIAAVIVAGVLADLLLWQLQPSPARPGRLRLFAFAIPVIFHLLYFLAVGLTWGIGWRIHLWLGSAVMAGIMGYSLSYLVVPPAVPSRT